MRRRMSLKQNAHGRWKGTRYPIDFSDQGNIALDVRRMSFFQEILTEFCSAFTIVWLKALDACGQAKEWEC